MDETPRPPRAIAPIVLATGLLLGLLLFLQGWTLHTRKVRTTKPQCYSVIYATSSRLAIACEPTR